MTKAQEAKASGAAKAAPPSKPSVPQTVPPTEMTGAQALIRSLELAGATDIFGLPGGAIMPAYDPLLDSTILRHILVRHEQGAGHAASGYAHATGRPGVCIVTSGPGATNLVTAIADANMDSIPIVCVTGQVNAASIGTDAFQETDIVGITQPITKHNEIITDPGQIGRAIQEAFHIATTGRPGPVLIDITKSALVANTTFSWPQQFELRGYHPVLKPHSKSIQEAARLLATARRPVLYVGGGVIRSGAWDGLRKLVDASGAAVVSTLMARGAVPDSHPQYLGMPGMHGTVPAVTALQRSDLIVALGARFDDRVTGKLDSFAPHATVVHADIDPAEIGKNREADVPIVGDLKDVFAELVPALAEEHRKHGKPDLEGWWRQLNELRETYPLGYTPTDDGHMAPQHVIQRIGEITGPEAIFVAGVGQHQMWASQFLPLERPRSFFTSGGLATMGYGLPAAMGAKVGVPDRTVWNIDGDGCFQMTNQELTTCVLNEIPIKVGIINNSSLGMVRQWQALFFNERYSHTDLNTGHGTRRIPDFVRLAEAMGCVGLRCESEDELDATITKANEIDDQPVVVDFTVSRNAMVWPMVAAGVSNDEIQYARGVAPVFERED
ncbi:MAG: acetolactate synthase large subunit [Demequinaceae bacterium]|nr:acetolactate synthase large subunit [Demequinaceae bacterium]